MRRVITVSLHGNAYALEEDAAEALWAYLEAARQTLASNADQAEILADLEQAIAEKSQRFLGPHKTVLRRAEMDVLLAELGPVEDEASTDHGAKPAEPSSAPPPTHRQHLYRIRQGQRISGVCNGLAAYFGLDVTWVRLAFFAFALLWGVTVLLYIVLVIILPVADTPEALAAAYGEPFNAREFVQRARREAAALTDRDWRHEKAELRAEWERSKSFVRTEVRDSLRFWRQKRLEARRRRRAGAPNATPGGATGLHPGASAPKASMWPQLIATLLLLPLVLVFGGLAMIWMLAILALITTGTLFGILLPVALPIWLAILLLFLVFSLITWPFRWLGHLLMPPNAPAGLGRSFSLLQSVVGLVALLALAFWATEHVATVTQWVEAIRAHWSALLEQLHEHGRDSVAT